MATTVIVCVNHRADKTQPSCAARGSLQIAEALRQGIETRNLNIQLETVCCLGHCTKGPNLRIAPGGAFMHNMTLADVPNILDTLETDHEKKT